MKNDFDKLIEMIEETEMLNYLRDVGLSDEELVGYLEFFADNQVKNLTTILEAK